MLIIGLSGYAASGKSEAAKYLKNKYGFETFEFSREIEEEAKKLNLIQEKLSLEEKKRRLSEIGKTIREKYGREDYFAIKIAEKIKKENIDRVTVDGFRNVIEVEVFKKEFNKNFWLIFIKSDAKIRYERRKQQDKFFNLSFEEFLKRDKEDIKNLGLDKIEENSNFIIENNSSLKDFYEKIDLIIKSLI
ncbi:MAG: AAA family ATPase [Candidatus Aenigmatarchaeota archaeon]